MSASDSPALDQPLVVVALDELGDDRPRLLERLKAMEIEALLLFSVRMKRSMTPLHSGADIRRRDRDPQSLHLVAPGIGNILRPPVAAYRESPGDVLAEGAEGVALGRY